MKELIVDVSHWNDPVDYQALKAAGFVGLIAKSGGSLYPDDMLAVHAAGARAAGLLLGLYYWVDPLIDECAQGKHLIQQAIDHKANFLAADNEQWWSSWALWRRAIQRKIAWSEIPKIPSQQINKASRGFLRYLRQSQSRPLLNYTGIGFINQYCREMLAWINDFPAWLAQYHPTGPNHDLKKKTLTYDELKADYLPTAEPYIPDGMNPPDAWQWTGDRFTCPGSGGPMDITWWMNEHQSFVDWVGTTPPDPVELPWLDRKLKSWVIGLNVRTGPGVQYPIIRVLVPGLPIRVEPGKFTWAKLYGEPGYIHSAYLD